MTINSSSHISPMHVAALLSVNVSQLVGIERLVPDTADHTRTATSPTVGVGFLLADRSNAGSCSQQQQRSQTSATARSCETLSHNVMTHKSFLPCLHYCSYAGPLQL